MIKIPTSIFREYDIRGVVGKDLTDETVRLLGKGAGTYLSRRGIRGVALGRDVRLSSKPFRDSIIKGLVETGCEVFDIGVVTTPMLYFSLFDKDLNGGLMITGSHNPPDFNGFKIAEGKSTIYGDKIQEVRAIIESGEFSSGSGNVEQISVIDDYCDAIKKRIKMGERRLKVVVDAGNGTTGPTSPRIIRDLGCEVTGLYCEPDGRFPNHHPDPTLPAALETLRKKVLDLKADVGIGFDGDGDRIGVIDEKGNIIWMDILLILFARDLLSRRSAAKVIYDVKCSHLCSIEIKKAGGVPIMWKTGHSLIKKKMKEEGALLAGEMSGHVCFADNYFGYDDATFAACRLVEILSKTDRTLSELLSDIPKTFATPEIRVDCPDDKKFGIVKLLKTYFDEHYNTIDIDGVRVVFKDGWGLVRPSNTQPVLVLRFEAETAERLEEIKRIVVGKLKEYLPVEI
jgi:phosphomannomutase/phosphoglucomutase